MGNIVCKVWKRRLPVDSTSNMDQQTNDDKSLTGNTISKSVQENFLTEMDIDQQTQTNDEKSLTGNTGTENVPENCFTEDVFGNDLIFEKILSLLIFDANKKPDREMVKTLRLVHRRFLNTTSTLLKRTTRPFMVLRETNIRTIKVRRKTITTEYPLSEIVENLISPQRPIDSVLPFKLTLTPNYFSNENDQILLNCLTDLGNELVELEVNFSNDGVMMPFKLPRLKLPELRKISFQFSNFQRNFAHYYNSEWITEIANLLIWKIFTITGTENLQNADFRGIPEEKLFQIQQILEGTEDLRKIIFSGITQERIFQLREFFHVKPNCFHEIFSNKFFMQWEIKYGIEKIEKFVYSRIAEERLLQLQDILNGTENLQTIVFQKNSLSKFPRQFQSLQIPDSVTSVEFQDIFTIEYEKILSRNSLPKLTHLTLVLSSTPSQTKWVFKVLEHLKHSLISLHVSKQYHNDKAVVTFPKFEKLKTIQLKGTELESDSALNLQELFPSVTSIGLHYQTEAALSSWIQNSKFELVKSLSLSVLAENRQNNEDLFKSTSMEILRQVHKAFPNLSALTIILNCKDTSGLISVCQNMVQLKSLVIYIPDYCTHRRKCNYECSLIGLPMSLILAHSEDSESFQDFVRERGKKPCINNLFELTSFTLLVQTSDDMSAREVAQRLLNCTGYIEPMFSNLLFTQAFFHMPKLQKITLSKNIQPTKIIEDQWKAQGRHIQYTHVTNRMKVH